MKERRGGDKRAAPRDGGHDEGALKEPAKKSWVLKRNVHGGGDGRIQRLGGGRHNRRGEIW